MPVTPIKPVVLTAILPQEATKYSGPDPGYAAQVRARQRAGEKDTVVLSPQALAAGAKGTETAAAQTYGRFKLGDTGFLPFGPNQDANALNRIPGDGYQAPAEGVQFGHRPARGLNILA
jgi:hypothetical protein